jgi:hypothetical protein
VFVTVTTSEHYKRHNCCSCTFLHSLPLPLPPSNDQVSSSAPSLGNKQTAYSHSTDTNAELKIRGIRHHRSGDKQYSLLGSDAVSMGEYFPMFRRTVRVRSFERSQTSGLTTQRYLLNLTNLSPVEQTGGCNFRIKPDHICEVFRSFSAMQGANSRWRRSHMNGHTCRANGASCS